MIFQYGNYTFYIHTLYIGTLFLLNKEPLAHSPPQNKHSQTKSCAAKVNAQVKEFIKRKIAPGGENLQAFLNQTGEQNNQQGP